MIGLCDNCALKYADCKGNKDKEKCRCDYYKKPVVMNVKELAEKVAELEIKLKDSVEVVRCKECIHQKHCHETVAHTKRHAGFIEHWSETIKWCSRGERRGGDTE